jgi:membrane associated rhomboid family serine protease
LKLNQFAARTPSNRAIHSTPFVLGLIGLLIAVHLLGLIPWRPLQVILALASFVPSLFAQAIVDLPEWLPALLDPQSRGVWVPVLVLFTPLTHALLHADFIHLTVNSAFLLAFGTEIDRRIGGPRMLLLSVLGAIGGALAVLLTFVVVGQPTIVIGASGAVSALLGALVRPMRERRMTVIVVFVAINVVLGFTGFPSTHGVQGIAWDAHIGGFFTGFLLYPLFRRGPRLA